MTHSPDESQAGSNATRWPCLWSRLRRRAAAARPLRGVYHGGELDQPVRGGGPDAHPETRGERREPPAGAGGRPPPRPPREVTATPTQHNLDVMWTTKAKTSSSGTGAGVPRTAAAVALVLTAGSGTAAGLAASHSPRRPQAAAGPVVTPGAVGAIVAADTAVNNRANGSLSLSLQDSHESCLQQVLDDATFRGMLAAGNKTLGASFTQVPSRALVPRQTSYPAYFSVLVSDRGASQPTTTSLLNYSKTSASARWKLSSSSEILGPTSAGAAVPAVAANAQGYVTSLDPAAADGLVTAPGKVAQRVASAFTAEAASGKLPAGVSAQFGPRGAADPHAIAVAYARLGSVTTSFSTSFPPSAAAGRPSKDCPFPSYRLDNGGALVTFAIFSQLHVSVAPGTAVVQPASRSVLGALLPPGMYSSFTITSGDMGVAIVPPAGSRSPVQVIGQATEALSETGAGAPSSSGSIASGGPANAAAIARSVDPGIVDVNVVLGYQGAAGAGTGMVLTPSGEVLTNNHVVEGATSIKVTDVGNGRTYGAKVVGYDRESDAAVLQLQGASGLRTVGLGKSSSVRVGDGVVAIGNAGGGGGTPSYAGGRVIALRQSITASDALSGASERLTGLIESNAAIQSGDSGGPLVGSNGKVVGMDTAAASGFSFGIGGGPAVQGYSIPIDTALGIARLIEAGDASSTIHIGATAFLGVTAVGAFVGAGGTGAPVSSGALLQAVLAGGPAARAGLVPGDTITSLAGHAVASPSALTAVLLGEKPGAAVAVGYVDAAGARHTGTVQLGSGPAQ